MAALRPFQFRVTTLLVCILTTGLMIHANLTEDCDYNYVYGWPFFAVSKESWALWDARWVWRETSLFWNIFFAALIIFDAGYTCEMRSRREDAIPRTRSYLPALLCVLMAEILLFPMVSNTFASSRHRYDAVLTFGPALFAV